MTGGCAHRQQTDLGWAMDSGAPIHDSGEQVRGRSLGDLEVTVELYGVRSWTHPIDEEHRAGSPYGPRTGPISGRPGFHQGQDIPCERGEPVYAVADGEVITSRRSRSAGNTTWNVKPTTTRATNNNISRRSTGFAPT